jgi:hypothetical protein
MKVLILVYTCVSGGEQKRFAAWWSRELNPPDIQPLGAELWDVFKRFGELGGPANDPRITFMDDA